MYSKIKMDSWKIHEDTGAAEARDVVTTCIDFLRLPKEDWTPARRAALDTFISIGYSWQSMCARNIKAPWGEVPNASAMLAIVKLISKIFFNGLTDNIALSWGPNHPLAKPPAGGASNATFWCYTAYVNNSGPTRINFMPQARQNDETPIDVRDRVLESLVHESLHAYFMEHACKGGRCKCAVESIRYLGEDSHGPAWFQVAFAIKAFWDEHIPGPNKLEENIFSMIRQEFSRTANILEDEDIADIPNVPGADDIRKRLTLFRSRSEKVNAVINMQIDTYAGVRRSDRVYLQTLIPQFRECRLAAVADETQWDQEVDDLTFPGMFGGYR